MNLYRELRERQQNEFNSFPISFAYSKEQFEDGMRRLGLEPNETNKVTSISAGGFIRKSDVDAFKKMIDRHKKQHEKAIADDKDGSGYIKDMFSYELANHEYDYTGDLEDTLDALDLTIEKVNKNPKLLKGLKLALRRYRTW